MISLKNPLSNCNGTMIVSLLFRVAEKVLLVCLNKSKQRLMQQRSIKLSMFEKKMYTILKVSWFLAKSIKNNFNDTIIISTLLRVT